MGTKSKQGYNERCTVRGPASATALDNAAQVLQAPKSFNRADRRAAVQILKKQIKQNKKLSQKR